MISACIGTIRPSSITANSASRPGKRSRAKAKAAAVQVASWPAVTRTAILKLFQYIWSSGTLLSNTAR
jgi:hypothetical protein